MFNLKMIISIFLIIVVTFCIVIYHKYETVNVSNNSTDGGVNNKESASNEKWKRMTKTSETKFDLTKGEKLDKPLKE